MNLVTFLIIIIVFSILTIVWLLFKIKKTSPMTEYILKYEKYQAILEFFLEKAYNIIYKDRIFIYSLDGQKPTEDDFKTASIDFSKLALRLMGTTIIEEYIRLYGDLDTLLFNITEYFSEKSEHDEIYQTSIDELMESKEIEWNYTKNNY